MRRSPRLEDVMEVAIRSQEKSNQFLSSCKQSPQSLVDYQGYFKSKKRSAIVKPANKLRLIDYSGKGPDQAEVCIQITRKPAEVKVVEEHTVSDLEEPSKELHESIIQSVMASRKQKVGVFSRNAKSILKRDTSRLQSTLGSDPSFDFGGASTLNEMKQQDKKKSLTSIEAKQWVNASFQKYVLVTNTDYDTKTKFPSVMFGKKVEVI